MKLPPCKDCPKRSAKCHSTCEEYRNWSDERKEVLAVKYKDCMTTVALNAIKYKKGN